MKKATDVAEQLFKQGCTCGGIDIGVGQMHDPYCGFPTPDSIASAIREQVKEALEEAMRRICRCCRRNDPFDEKETCHRVNDGLQAKGTPYRLVGCSAQAIRKLLAEYE